MIVKPFRGLRPSPALAAEIPSVPYDVVTTDEARELARGNPHSFLHVIRPEIDLEPGLDPHDDRVYEKGRESFDSFVTQGWLVRDVEPAFYVYRLRTGDHSQTGIVGAAAVQDYLDGGHWTQLSAASRHHAARSTRYRFRCEAHQNRSAW